jgi:hypothetical protein
MQKQHQRDFQITVETPMGSHTVTVWPNQHIQSVLGEVLARDEIRRNMDQYSLVWNQQPLDNLDLIRSAGVEPGDTIYLESNPVSI